MSQPVEVITIYASLASSALRHRGLQHFHRNTGFARFYGHFQINRDKLNRMVRFADHIGKPIQLLYYPPYHSKYNPIERCWGILEVHWNGTKLVDVETMMAWAKSMTWKRLHPVVTLSRKGYQKGIALGKKAMQEVEHRLERHPELPKWNILIRPFAAL